MITNSDRECRFHNQQYIKNDFRTKFEHDYDRVIYSSYLRRLANVTQIFNPSEGVIFHNRLTHTLKVSQVAIRIAQKILRSRKYPKKDLLNVGGLDCDVVSTAALAHDLGNPPFGHAAESELNRLIMKDGILDGFEGNAQSFRIVTRLATHNGKYPGLDLTKASLNALLKYPYKKERESQKKFGAYSTEYEYFNFARTLTPYLNKKKCLEASIMDISDDITYGIHDLLDLLRQGLLPFRLISETSDELSKNGEKAYRTTKSYPDFSRTFNIIDTLSKDNYHEEWAPNWHNNRKEIIKKVALFFKRFDLLFDDPNYEGFKEERVLFKNIEDFFLNGFIASVQINLHPSDDQNVLFLDDDAADTLIILKAITKSFIVNSTSLIKQQCGERKIVKQLYEAFKEAISDEDLRVILPARTREELVIQKIKDSKNPIGIRLITDAISGLTDSEAISSYYVLSGIQPGSIFDRISL